MASKLPLAKSFFIHRWKILFLSFTGFVITLLLVSALIGWIYYLKDKDKIIHSAREYRNWLRGESLGQKKNPVMIYADNGEIIGEYTTDFSSRMSLHTCKNLKWMNLAVISSEDRDFYSHNGISWKGILRASFRNITSLRPREGAGSITQQLARNLYTVKKMPVLIRKFYETWAAFLLEKHLSKNEILCLYLNRIYMGEGRYGAEDASWFYFRKPPEKLTPAEAAMIAGIFPSPRRYSPLNHITNSMKKQAMVLDALAEEGHIAEKNISKEIEFFKAKYKVIVENKETSSGTIGLYGYNRSFKVNLAPDVNEYVIRYITSILPQDKDFLPGMKIYTTINKRKQLAAIQSVRNTVESIRDASAKSAPFPPQKMEVLLNEFNGVFIALEPTTGKILAMVGGFKTGEESYTDRVWSMLRQPGSTIKGFLYALALEEDIVHLESTVIDEPTTISGYKPANWYGGYKGQISLEDAVALSVNTIPVKLLQKIGIGKFRNKLSQAADIPLGRMEKNLSLALGSSEVTPMELARLYGIFLNSGYKVNPYLIKKIEYADSTVVEEASPQNNSEKIFSDITCRNTVQLLKASIENQEGTAAWLGKAMHKKGMSFPVAAKTGTVQTDATIRKQYRNIKGSHDVWFVALVPGEVDVAWFGNDSGMPFSGSGAGTAGGAWLQYSISGLNQMDAIDFKPFQKNDSENNDIAPLQGEQEENPAPKTETIKNPPVDYRNEPIYIPEEKPAG